MSNNVTFNAQQAYVATLAMRLGKPVPVATIMSWSPQQLQQAKSSANTRLSQAQAAAQAKVAKGLSVPVQPHQHLAVKAWAWGLKAKTAQLTYTNGLQANSLLSQAGQRSKGQHALVQQVYACWLRGMASQQSGQLALF